MLKNEKIKKIFWEKSCGKIGDFIWVNKPYHQAPN